MSRLDRANSQPEPGARALRWAASVVLAVALACSATPASSPSPSRAALSTEPVAGCIVAGPEICFNAKDDNCNGLIDEGCGLDSGIVQFAIAWEESEADVDLEVTDPAGRLVEVGGAEGGLSKDRDCPGKEDACRGINLENVVSIQGEEPQRGKYLVKVRLEQWKQLEHPVRVNLGARLGPKHFAAEIVLQREKQERRFELEL